MTWHEISIVIVGALVFVVVRLSVELWRAWGEVSDLKEALRRATHTVLDSLSEEEKAILRGYVEGGSRVRELPLDDPAVRSLVEKGIVHPWGGGTGMELCDFRPPG